MENDNSKSADDSKSHIQENKVKLSATVEYASVGFNETKELLVLGTIHAPAYEPDERSSRAPIDLVAVIDRSGSMSGEKLELVIETLKFMLQQLKAEDRLSLVSYDTSVTVDVPLQKMSTENKTLALDKITKLKAGSSTNLSGGLISGLEQLLNRETMNEVASVLLFTDGLANHGLTKTQEIVEVVDKTRAKMKGACTVFSFGYGKDHDSNMLKAIAEKGMGLYYYIENADDIPESFADCIGGLLSVVAQNISLTIESTNSTTIKKLLTHFTNKKESDTKHTVQLGDLYSEENRNVVCNVVLPKLEKETDSLDILKFTLSYFNVCSASHEKETCVATVKRPTTTPEGQVRDYFLDRQRNRLQVADTIEAAKTVADSGNLDQARQMIKSTIASVQQSLSGNDEYCKSLISDLQEALDGMIDKQEYEEKGNKKMMWKAQAHHQERAVGKGGYETKAKENMKMKMMEHMKKPAPPQKTNNNNNSNTITLNKKIKIGNEHSMVPDDQITISTTTGAKLNNKWKMYVRGDDVDSFIEKIEFVLHPSFQPSNVTVSAAPWELERVGWGFFIVHVTIHFKPDLNKLPCVFDHELFFDKGGIWEEHEV